MDKTKKTIEDEKNEEKNKKYSEKSLFFFVYFSKNFQKVNFNKFFKK